MAESTAHPPPSPEQPHHEGRLSGRQWAAGSHPSKVQSSRSMLRVFGGVDVNELSAREIKILADRTLENGHLQVVYGPELGLVGTPEVPGTRLVLCLNNHCLVVDFPPAIAGFRFDLSQSCSAQLWPVRRPAGVATLNIEGPAGVDRVLVAICRAIRVEVDIMALRV